MQHSRHMALPLSVVLFGVFAFFYNTVLVLSTPQSESQPPHEQSYDLPIAELFQLEDPRVAAQDTLLFTGDIMLGRHVERLITQQGPSYPFEKIQDVLHTSDITVGNLEGPIPAIHRPTPDFSTTFSFTESTAPLLAEQGFDIVTLGNNHTRDQGEEAYLHTRRALQAVNIESPGDALSVTEHTSIPLDLSAGTGRLFSFNMTFPQNDPEEAVETVRNRRALEPNSFYIVGIHWGAEYRLTSNAQQQQLAHQLIDAGADLIIGHHPHVVQEVERYQDGLIFYSLGNFIFDQYFSQDVQEGLLVQLTLTDETASYNLMPIQSARSQPQLMSSEQKQTWLEKLAERSPTQAEAVRTGSIEVPYTP